MELFLRIPHEKREADGSPVRMALLDLKGAVTYLIRENTCLFKLLIVVAGINLFLSALFIIGLPYLVKIYLGGHGDGLDSRRAGIRSGREEDSV